MGCDSPQARSFLGLHGLGSRCRARTLPVMPDNLPKQHDARSISSGARIASTFSPSLRDSRNSWKSRWKGPFDKGPPGGGQRIPDRIQARQAEDRPSPLTLHKLCNVYGIPERRMLVLAGAIKDAPQGFSESEGRRRRVYRHSRFLPNDSQHNSSIPSDSPPPTPSSQ